MTNFSSIGYLTYKRTYARYLDASLGADSPTEEWPDTVERVLKSCRTQLKVGFTEDEEDRFRDYMLDLKCSPAGRFLWQLGTATVDQYGLASLQNCAFTLVDDPIRPFVWTMDMLALGAGVGFNIQREYVDKIPEVRPWFKAPTRFDDGGADFIVPDSREGWVKLLGKTLKAAFLSEEPERGSFTYSTQIVRTQGMPIKGFGGVASGAQPLCKGISKISKVLEKRAGKKIRPVDALDLMNIIGETIVSGNVRRCLPAGTMVHTISGLKTIENIEKDEKVLTPTGYKKVIGKYNQGLQQLVRIYTQDGFFECTPNHRMAIMTGVEKFEWIYASELKEGDRLCTTRESLEGVSLELPNWYYEKKACSTTCKDIVIPKLDADLAWLIGAIHGNGYIYANKENNGFNAYVGLKFNKTNIESAIFCAEQLMRFGTNNVEIFDTKNENSITIRCMSKQLAWYFYDNIKQTKTNIVIPEFIINNTLDVRLGYIAGVADTDGSLKNKPIKLVTSVYEPFVLQLQNLCYSCGFETRFYIGKERPNSWQKIYELSLISEHSKRVVSNIPQLHLKLRSSSKENYSNSFPSNWISDSKLKRKTGYTDTVTASAFERFTGKKLKLIPVRVLTTEETGIRETYDIEVEDANCFFANGYLVHNSAQLAIFDGDDIECLLAKRFDLGNVPSHRAMSNNSVICNDLNDLHEYFWDTYTGRGEPLGLINLELSKKVGRLGETQYPDPNILGYNPLM